MKKSQVQAGRWGARLLCFGQFLCLALSAPQVLARAVEAVPGEYLVQVSRNKFINAREVLAASGIVVKHEVISGSGLFLVQRPVPEALTTAKKFLLAQPIVEHVEPNLIYHVVRTPNDPEYEKLWGLNNVGQIPKDGMPAGVNGIDIGTEKAWDIQTGSRDVIVAVVDTGVDHSQEDLAPNMWVNEREANGRVGIDDDGNGFIDDIYGYNFVSDTGDAKDDNSHGTHVAGTIGAKGNDGRGIVGVTWDVRIMSLKFLDKGGGGTLEGAIRAIDYGSKMGARIMNASWAGAEPSELLKEAIARAEKAGVLFVAAAGNNGSNNDKVPSYPASYDLANILTVAAVTSRGELAKFSNYGRKSVDVAAPGVGIMSTTPQGYKFFSGTSMATPHVTGIAALLLSQFPRMTYAEMKERIIRTAKPLDVLRKKIASGGVANAYFALTDIVPPPAPMDPRGWATVASVISSEHPYREKSEKVFEVSVPGAKEIAVHFSRFALEKGFDRVYFMDAEGKIVGFMTGEQSGEYSPTVHGDRLTMKLISDESTTGYGFDVDHIAFKN